METRCIHNGPELQAERDILLLLPVRVQGPLWSIDALVTMYKVTVRRLTVQG